MVQSIRIESTTLHRQNVRIIRVNHGRILVRLFLPLGDLFTIETAIYNDYQRLMLNCFFFHLIWFGLVHLQSVQYQCIDANSPERRNVWRKFSSAKNVFLLSIN